MRLFNGHNVQDLNRLFLLVNSVEDRVTSTYMHPKKVVVREVQFFLVISSRSRIFFQRFELPFNQTLALLSQ
jgi:hypothetical protein